MISVIVPAHDAGATLDACLTGLAAAGFRNVTVVDDRSTDRTAEIARAHGARLIRTEGSHGAAAARNAGVAASAGEILLFVDADVVVRPDTGDRIRTAFADPDLDAVFGAYDDRPSAPGHVSVFRNLLHHHVHMRNAGPATTFWTGLGAVRRSAFEKAGGFAPDQAMMEDVRLGIDLARTGHAILLDPSIQGTHLKRWSLRGMVRTDFHHRAIPWLRLMRRHPQARGLNVSARGKVAVASVGLSALGLLLAPFWPPGLWLALLGLAGMIAAEWSFLRLMRRLHDTAGAIRSVPLLWLHHFTAGLAVLRVQLLG